jgi:hypothetical protein
MWVKLIASHANDLFCVHTPMVVLKHMNKVIVTIRPSIMLGFNGDWKWISYHIVIGVLVFS